MLINETTVKILIDERQAQARRYRLAEPARQPSKLQRQAGQSLISLGHRLAGTRPTAVPATR